MIKVRKPEILKSNIHIEQQEKPIVEALLKISEDFHGGDEVTQSVDDQRFAQQEPSKEQEESETEQEEQEEQASQNEENTKEQEEEIQEQEEQTEEGQEESEQNSEEQTEKQGEQKEQAKGQKDEEESEQEEREENEEEKTEKQEEQTKENKEKNSEQAFKLTGAKGQLFLQIYKLVEYLSDEQKTLTPDPVSATQALNVKRLMLRQHERKTINSYYYYRERSEVIMLLDDSGSMSWIQEALNNFFAVALKRKDVQVYIAPNGILEEAYNFKTKQFENIEHEETMKKISQTGLPIIYVGDFDGANTPVELSWTNKLFWICTETRYKYFSEHDWVDYNEEDFKGFFGRAFNVEEIVQVLQEFSRHIQQQHFWYDTHKDEDFEEDEE